MSLCASDEHTSRLNFLDLEYIILETKLDRIVFGQFNNKTRVSFSPPWERNTCMSLYMYIATLSEISEKFFPPILLDWCHLKVSLIV